MVNRYRGEIEAELDGRKYTLCLTLGALAELESAFASTNLVDLAQRFENGRLSARDLVTIIACGLRGAGVPVSDTEVASMRASGGLAGYVSIVTSLFSATFGELHPNAVNTPHPTGP